MSTNTAPIFVNAHTHSHAMPFKGSAVSTPFDVWIAYRLAIKVGSLKPEQQEACALVCGLENLVSGNGAIIDHLYSPMTEESVYSVAQAYEALGIRAWVFPNIDDLPVGVYTKRFYPDYPKAIPDSELPERARAQIEPVPFEPRLQSALKLIQEWKGKRVQMGLALGNPIWCSDALLESASYGLRTLDVPLEIHVEESPVQREASIAQWGMSGVQRLDSYGLLSPKTLAAHCVQVSEEDIDLLGSRGVAVSHNPLSNMKLQNGIAPIGHMLKAGVNVTLGSDGSNSGDEQSLAMVLRIVSCLARLNGLYDVNDKIEEQVVKIGSTHGHKLWFPDSINYDNVEYREAVDPVKLVWTDLASHITEVHIDGEPVLQKAKDLVREKRAFEIVAELAGNIVDTVDDALIRECLPLLKRYARSI